MDGMDGADGADGGVGDTQGKAGHSQERTNTTGMDMHPNGNAQGGGGQNVPGLDLSRLASPFGFRVTAANRATEGRHDTDDNNNPTTPSYAQLHTAVTQVRPYTPTPPSLLALARVQKTEYRGDAQSSNTASAVRLGKPATVSCPAVLAPSEMLHPHPQLPDLPVPQ
jgi:hypothetical protein